MYSQFTNHPFFLHSVLIHEGVDNSGHYYVFVKDYKEENSYWKFSDINVSKSTTEEMFKDALGEFGNRAAFCLLYVNEEVREEIKRC